MTSIEHDDDASLAGFLAGWDKRLGENVQLPVGFAVLVLTSFGERPAPSLRLAEVLGRPVSEVEALAQAPCGSNCTSSAPAEDGFIRVADGLITYSNPDRAQSAPRRWLQVGDRRFGMTGCAFDVFLYAPLVRPSLQVEETCPATGTPIRIVFTPSGVETAGPAGAVVPIPPPQEFDRLERIPPTEVDATMCAVPHLLLRRGGSRMAGRSSRRPRLPRPGSVGSELPPSVAGPDAGPAEPRQLITGLPWASNLLDAC